LGSWKQIQDSKYHLILRWLAAGRGGISPRTIYQTSPDHVQNGQGCKRNVLETTATMQKEGKLLPISSFLFRVFTFPMYRVLKQYKSKIDVRPASAATQSALVSEREIQCPLPTTYPRYPAHSLPPRRPQCLD